MRVARRARSSFHDGFDTTYYLADGPRHPGLQLSSDPEAYDGWRALRFSDQQKFLSAFDTAAAASSINKENLERTKALSDKLWKLIDLLRRATTAKALKAAVEEITGNEWSKPNTKGLISRQPEYRIADALANGLMPACSLCKSRELISEYGVDGRIRTYCNGFFGATRCEFESHEFVPARTAICESTAGTAVVEIVTKLRKSGKIADVMLESSQSCPEAAEQSTEGSFSNSTVLPKKARTAKQIFDHVMGKTLQEAGTLNATQLKSQLTKAWKQLPANEKEEFQAKAKAEAAEHAEAVSKAKMAKASGKGASKRGAPAAELDGSAEKKQAGCGGSASTDKETAQDLSTLVAFEQGSASLRVDESFSGSGNILLTDDKKTAWSVKLNQTDLTTGINKYYVLQIITSGKQCYFFTKWGRTGERNRMTSGEKTERFSSAEGAMAAFEKKFQEKTGRSWSTRDSFQQKPGMYAMLMQDRGVSESKKKPISSVAVQRPVTIHVSKLDPRVRKVVSLIFDKQMQNKALQRQNVDLEKMPLGSLSEQQLLKGYRILSEISDILNEDKDATSDKRMADDLTRMKLKEATTRFYTTIPHSFKVNAVPPVIADHRLLKDKLEMMEALLAGNDAANIMVESEEQGTMHCDDANYLALKCKIVPIDPASSEYEMVRQYLANTQSQQHKRDFVCELEDVFRLDKEGEEAKFGSTVTFGDLTFTPSKLHNHRLLWHGSRLTNWAGILSQGLRIAPPEAPVTGYMFDKGVYFADMASKSAQYCSFQIGDRNPCGFLALCEVALGDQHELMRADERACQTVARARKHSCWGVGAYMPGGGPGKGWSGSQWSPAPDLKDVMVPLGAGCDEPASMAGMQPGQALTNERVKAGGGGGGSVHTDLRFNEFIVYRTEQIRFRYLVKATFHYADGQYDWDRLTTTTGVEFEYAHAAGGKSRKK